jgi:hypothetical protein
MATASYNLRSLMLKAHVTARYNARRHGGTIRSHLAAAMREAWAFEKRLRVEMAASNARVQAEIAHIRAMNSAEGVAQRAAAMAGWQARCGMPERRAFSRGFYR